MVEITVQQAINLLRTEEMKLKQLEEQKQNLYLITQEIELAKDNLETLQAQKDNALIQIGAGMFLPVKPQGQNIEMEIGSGVVLEKSFEEATAALNEREEKIKKAIETIEKRAQKTTDKVKKLSQRIREKMAQGQEDDMPVIG